MSNYQTSLDDYMERDAEFRIKTYRRDARRCQ